MTSNVKEKPRGVQYSETKAGARAVLSVRNLHVAFRTETGVNQAVRGVSFDLFPGKTLGIVGESGSGKSATSLAIMGLLPQTAHVNGSIRLRGQELLGLSDAAMSRYRGKALSCVFQDPLLSLNPVLTVGAQIVEALRAHSAITRKDARNRACELLDLVGITRPRDRCNSFPHELSGGMRQRVMIAMAVANNPQVLFADECTTALDVTIQAQVLEVLKTAQRETGAAVAMITHDLGVIAGLADEVLVMYAGTAVERGEAEAIFHAPRMPYTIGLLGSIPRIDQEQRQVLVPIEGSTPNLVNPPDGCAFADRCPIVTAECRHGVVPMVKVEGSHESACLKTAQTHRNIFPVPEDEARTSLGDGPHVLKVHNLVKDYGRRSRLVRPKREKTVRAVDGVSFEIRQGECFALVGESGCGKTTTLLEIMEFRQSQQGNITIENVNNRGNVADLRQSRRTVRRNVQMVFQSSQGALDPRFTLFEILAEPLKEEGLSREAIRLRIAELLQLVDLPLDAVNKFPSQFSGGQCQRIGIARAIAKNPRLLVLDEPFSALDVSVRAGVINLLQRLRAELQLSYLLVSHDLSVVRHISDSVAVMYLGRIVEIGDIDEVFRFPQHPYTQTLLSAVPIPDPVQERRRKKTLLVGDVLSTTATPQGCVFTGRCPTYRVLDETQRSRCRQERPRFQTIGARHTGFVPERATSKAKSQRMDHSYTCFFPERSTYEPGPQTQEQTREEQGA